MIKKVKVIFVLFILIGMVLFPLQKVNAHSVELDPKGLISFPYFISFGKGSIDIKDSETGYSLYYQAVQLSDSTFEQIEKTSEDVKKELEDIKKQLEAMEPELNSLEDTLDEKIENYKDASEEQKEQAKKEYETAYTNYQNKANEYNKMIDEYNTKQDEANAKIKELTPTYVENNWIKTEDKSFKVDLSEFSGKKSFAIWAKLVSSDGTISYDECTYTMNGSKVADVNVESITLNKTTLTIDEGSSYTLTATINPSNATNKLVDWSSDNEKVAKVENGKVTAISEGTATITAKTKDGGFTATCKVTVTKKIVPQNPSSTDNNKTNEPKANDATIAKVILPKTGTTTYIVIFSIVLLSIIGLVCYKKIKYYNFK